MKEIKLKRYCCGLPLLPVWGVSLLDDVYSFGLMYSSVLRGRRGLRARALGAGHYRHMAVFGVVCVAAACA